MHRNCDSTLKTAVLALDTLMLYRSLSYNGPLSRLSLLVKQLEEGLAGTAEIIKSYALFFHSLAAANKRVSLKDFIIESTLFDENPFTLRAETGRDMDRPLVDAALHDLSCLGLISGISGKDLFSQIKEYSKDRGDACGKSVERLPVYEDGISGRDDQAGLNTLKEQLGNTCRWDGLMESICDFHRTWGSGAFARYGALYWNGPEESFAGVEAPDPVSLSGLIGYEHSRSVVIENTLSFLSGLPANNVLLYGDRGTGKSSTVKAILNEYRNRGLRVIEVPKNNLIYFNELVKSLRDRSLKFIVFVDDLSFEDSESDYTAMKAVLEGGLEKKPDNVLVYATSNRRHLIKEKFSDRMGLLSSDPEDEVRASDTLQEKLSLSDRFGITAFFPSPGKEEFLEIVEGLAMSYGLRLDSETLRREALKWELNYNGRSPRTARQFVEWLAGRMKASGAFL